MTSTRPIGVAGLPSSLVKADLDTALKSLAKESPGNQVLTQLQAARVSTDSARGWETTGNNRHQPDNQDVRTRRPTRRRAARFPTKGTQELAGQRATITP